MNASLSENLLERLNARLSRLWKDPGDQALAENTIRALDAQYALGKKIAEEHGVAEIVTQMFGRLANSFERLAGLQGKSILDIACGSITSQAPGSLFIDTPFGQMTVGRAKTGYTAQFEPWFCRILLALGANPVGVDKGDLDREAFTHYRLDLGKTGALDFLTDHSFDAVQDSRLFGSPEFTAQFQNLADHVKVAQEIVRQEHRLLKAGGVIIHSDARALLASRSHFEAA